LVSTNFVNASERLIAEVELLRKVLLMETILKRSEILSNVMAANARNYTINSSVFFVLVFFSNIAAHPFMKTALIIQAITVYIFWELQFDAALVGRGALAQDALAIDPNSHYAKKVLSMPVGFGRAVMFIAMTLAVVIQVVLVLKY